MVRTRNTNFTNYIYLEISANVRYKNRPTLLNLITTAHITCSTPISPTSPQLVATHPTKKMAMMRQFLGLGFIPGSQTVRPV